VFKSCEAGEWVGLGDETWVGRGERILATIEERGRRRDDIVR
jgi:hypothetical protein